jgi:hypothetical protein
LDRWTSFEFIGRSLQSVLIATEVDDKLKRRTPPINRHRVGTDHSSQG